MQNDNTELIRREAMRLLNEDRLREALDFMYSEVERLEETQWFSPQEFLSRLADLSQELSNLQEGVKEQGCLDPENYDALFEKAYFVADHIGWHLTYRRPEHYNQLMDKNQHLHTRCLLMSLTTLHLLKHFDAEVTESLYLLTLDDQPLLLRVRAWVALALIALIHQKRITRNPRLQEQFAFIADTMHEGSKQDNLMLALQLMLMQCTDAMRAKELLHTTIQQMVIKYAKNHSAEETGGVIRTSPEGEEGKPRVMTVSLNLNDQDNAWLKTREGKRLRKQVGRYISLLDDGVDTQLDAFEMAAQSPFFSQHPDLWLTPFTLDTPEVKQVLETKPEMEPIIRAILNTPHCDTDKFMHLAMASSMKSDMLNLLNILQEKASDIFRVMHHPDPDESPLNSVPDVMRAYLHDLFRYCYYSGQVTVEENPFHHSLLFTSCPWLLPSVSKADELATIGQYLIRKERWQEAWQVYDLLLKTGIQKEAIEGWILTAQKSQMVPEADLIGRLYHFAYLFPEEENIHQQLGARLLDSKRYYEAELTLRKAVKRWPSNKEMRIALAKAQIQTGNSAEALEHLFQCDFQEEGDMRVQVPLATALLCLKRFEEAEKYIQPWIESGKADDMALIIGGHVMLCAGNITEATDRYQRAWYKRRNRKGQKLATFIDELYQTPVDVAATGIPAACLNYARNTLYNNLQRKSK